MYIPSGTHDLSKIKGPFVYNALPPTDISFVPLNETKSFRADHLMEHFMSNIQMKQYVPIIKVGCPFPLNETKSFNGDHLMEHFLSDIHMKKYVPIIKVGCSLVANKSEELKTEKNSNE